MGLRDAINKLNDAVTDLSSLHVQTYSGELGLKVDEKHDFESLAQSIKEAKESSEVTLVAESMLRFDGDSRNFVAEDAPPNLMDVHNEAVQSGLETRRSLIEMFKDAI